MNYTKTGYEIAVVGESLETARYAGMNISKVIVVAMLISGGLCGVIGMIQASAIEKTLVTGSLTITGLPPSSRPGSPSSIRSPRCLCVVFAMLIQGGEYIQIALGVPSAVSDVVQGLILFFVLGSEFFMRYKIHIGRTIQRRWLNHDRIFSSLRCSRNASGFCDRRGTDYRKTGNLNLGVEGMMLMGAVMGFFTGLNTATPVWPCGGGPGRSRRRTDLRFCNGQPESQPGGYRPDADDFRHRLRAVCGRASSGIYGAVGNYFVFQQDRHPGPGTDSGHRSDFFPAGCFRVSEFIVICAGRGVPVPDQDGHEPESGWRKYSGSRRFRNQH